MSKQLKDITKEQRQHFDEAYGPFPMPVTVTNEAREFVWVNPAFCAHYGKRADEVLGKTAACLVDAEGLQQQRPLISEFNEALESKGYSIRRFRNIAYGKEIRVLVVAFGRTIERRAFRVGVAIPDEFTSIVPVVSRLLLHGEMDLEGFLKELRKTPRHLVLLKDLSVGSSVKASSAYRTEKQNRKALDRVVKIAKKHCDKTSKPRVDGRSMMHLAVLLADRLQEILPTPRGDFTPFPNPATQGKPSTMTDEKGSGMGTVTSACGSLPRQTMSGKPVLWREAKTVLTRESEAFQEKLLCDGLTFNPGDLCVYSCSFCYVESQVRKLVYREIREHNDQASEQRGCSEVVVRRQNAVGLLKGQIRSKDDNPNDKRVVYGSTLVDVAANVQLLKETAELVTLILDKTHWQVRLLSKSNLLHKLMKDRLIPDRRKEGNQLSHHQRIIFGFSTGTFDDKLAAAFEQGTALVSKRLEALHWLQDEGFRTFGMVCPSLPQDDYAAFARDAVHRLRPAKMEHVWAEVINVRGESFQRTRKALLDGGFKDAAERLASVSDGPGVRRLWEQYARATFEAHRNAFPSGKLRFLQYVDSTNLDWWKDQRINGAVLLGKTAQNSNVCSHERSATSAFY